MKPKSLTILSFSSLFLVGCANFSPSIGDTKSIQWYRVSQATVNEICAKAANPHYKNGFWGCARWSADKLDNRCHVYTVDTLKPFSPQEQYVLGHEVMHCFKDQYHH